MADFVVMEVYSVDAEDAESAANSAKASSPNSDAVFLVADSLGGLANPYHLADAQSAFGHIAPAQAPAEELTDEQ
jgi:hypothetical protein